MPTPFPALAPAANVDDVVDRIDAVLAWSIAEGSRLGYFAALYKRITRAIGAAVAAGSFDDPARMARLDAIFANRYFAALNGYFDAANHPAPSHCWRVAFDAALRPSPIIVLHMLAGVNAHITLDLGIATHAAAAGAPIESIQRDFNTVNTVLGGQVKTVLDEIDSISPVLAALYDVLAKEEISLIDEGLATFRDDAWRFATLLSLEPGFLDGSTITVRDLQVATFSSLIYAPPPAIASVTDAIARQESTDIAKNITVLNGIASAAL